MLSAPTRTLLTCSCKATRQQISIRSFYSSPSLHVPSNGSYLRRRGMQQCLFQSSSSTSGTFSNVQSSHAIGRDERFVDRLSSCYNVSTNSTLMGSTSLDRLPFNEAQTKSAEKSIEGFRIRKDFNLVSMLVNDMNQQRFSSRHQIRNYNVLHCRLFSSTTNKNEGEKKSSNNDKAKRQDELVDKEFAAYLTGKTDEMDVSTVSTSPQGSSNGNNALSESNEKQSDAYNEEVEKVEEIGKAAQSKGDWFNSLLNDQSDLGRPNLEVNETYKIIERKNFRNIQKLREKQITTVRRALGGNIVIAGSKLAAYLHSGSSAMLSEFIHSVVDCGNQSLLLVGLRDSGNEADRSHPYGYGKSIYFWALVSALGTFFLGAGVSMTQAIPQLIYGGNLHEITWTVWGVLGFSFVVDGYVFTKTLMEVNENAPDDTTLFKRIKALRDPATLAILLEDGAACLGVVMAIGGIAATQAFDMPVYDALAGVGISGLLAAMGIVLVRVNHRFLLGQAVDKEIREGIEQILLNRRSIDNVNSVQSQWTGPDTFSYKAEVDFDGTFLAAKLMPRYQQEFAEARATLDQDLRVLLSWYAEDVMRTVEREVRNIEAEIRREYPGAQYIELEPMSKDADRFAIDDGLEASLKRIEIEALNRYLKSLYQPGTEKPSSTAPGTSQSKGTTDETDK